MATIRNNYKLPPITLLHVLIEFGIILFCVFFSIRHLLNFSPNVMVGNLNYPTAMLQYSFSAAIFQKTGNITIWDPFAGFGEPMFENLATSILSPLVTWPVLIFGPVQAGKINLITHALLLAFGGWSLARILRLDWAGRILLALLCFGNGSVVSQFGQGFTHMAYPQAYIPWVFTGLIAALYMRRRWGVGMTTIATLCMVFSGGIWYVLPTAIACGAISLFSLPALDPQKKLRIDLKKIRKMILIVFFILGIGAIRWLTYNRGLVFHPDASQAPGVGYFDIASAFFFPTTPQPEYSDLWINYHYVLAASLAIFLVGIRLFVYRPAEPYRAGIWRILVPAGLVILFLTLWAEGDTWFTQWLYKTIPLLDDWKNSGRIGAGVTPWIAVYAAIWFDDIVYVVWHSVRGKSFADKMQGFIPSFMDRHKLKLRLPHRVATFALIAVVGITFAMTTETMNNWPTQAKLSRVDEWDRNEANGLRFLRTLYPHQMLTVLTQGWVEHFGFMDTLSRSSHADATIFTVGLPATVGPDLSMHGNEEFAVGSNPDFIKWLKNNGFQPVPGAPVGEGNAIAWQNPMAPPYAFTIERSKLQDRDWHPIARAEVNEVSYYHRITNVETEVGDYPPDSLLVIDETAYPGWIATIDGQPVDTESVGSRMAVVLPDKPAGSAPTNVTFSYRPPLLYLGGFLTIEMSLLCALYLLRVDERIPIGIRRRARVASQQVMKVLTDPTILESKPNPDELKALSAGTIPLLPPPEPKSNGNNTSEPEVVAEQPDA